MKLIEVRDDVPVGEQLDIGRQNETALLNEINRLNSEIGILQGSIEELKKNIQSISNYME